MKKQTTQYLLALLICLPLCGTNVTRAADDEKTLEALGGLSVAYMYQTYLTIGMIGDGVAKKTMDAAAGKQLLTSVVKMTEVIDKQLGAVADAASTSAENKKSLEEFRSIIGLLHTEGQELLAMMDGDATHAEKYDTARKSAWEKIKTIMGIKD